MCRGRGNRSQRVFMTDMINFQSFPKAEEAVKRRLVPRVGRETVRILLLDHDLKPWREKNVVRARTR